jgi:hypothetical protein
MRWGVQEHAADDHSTVDVCLQELDQCCQLSLATNCVVSCSLERKFSLSLDSIEPPIWRTNVTSTNQTAYF